MIKVFYLILLFVNLELEKIEAKKDRAKNINFIHVKSKWNRQTFASYDLDLNANN